eukprot:218601_1
MDFIDTKIVVLYNQVNYAAHTKRREDWKASAHKIGSKEVSLALNDERLIEMFHLYTLAKFYAIRGKRINYGVSGRVSGLKLVRPQCVYGDPLCKYHPRLDKFKEYLGSDGSKCEELFSDIGPKCKSSYKHSNEDRGWWILYVHKCLMNEKHEIAMIENEQLVVSGLFNGHGFLHNVPRNYVYNDNTNANDNNSNTNNSNTNNSMNS